MTETQIKAKELIEKFYKHARPISSGFFVSNENVYIKSAKECALICVDEILKELPENETFYFDTRIEFYQEVKQEITNYK